MRKPFLAALALAALGSTPAAAAADAAAAPDAVLGTVAVQRGGVQVWLDDHRSVFRSGERMRVRVRADRDAYVAVFHIDTNGDVDVLYPRSYDDEGWVPRGRTLSLGSRGWGDYLRVRGGPGMGYVFAVALDEPLEMWRVRDLYRSRFAGWDGNRTVFGDPFYAMDELVRAVVPEGAYGYESTDYYTYHVGRRYSYPRYACYDGYGDWYHSRVDYYHGGGCSRVRILLGRRPHYYDTYYYRGPRRVYYEPYYRQARVSRPLHGYKERTSSQAPPARRSYERRPEPGAPGTREATAGRRDGTVGGRGTDTDRPTTRRPEAGTRPSESDRDRGSFGSRRPASDSEDRGSFGSRRPADDDGRTSGARRGSDDEERPRVYGGGRRTGDAQQQDTTRRERPTFQRRPQEPTRRETPPARERERETPQRERTPTRTEPRRSEPPRRTTTEPRRSEPRRTSEPRRERPADSGGSTRSRPSESDEAPRVRSPEG
ncbi:MAG TPA: DUF4384 domain-containing protein [Longimicrobium sp.]|nr:DUF4384 domain-containing protein [Longimicrobium sp.]